MHCMGDLTTGLVHSIFVNVAPPALTLPNKHDNFCVLQAAVSMLKQEYKEGETDLQTALELSIKVLSKTLDTNKLTPEKGL